MQLIPPATSCEHTGEMSSSLLETRCSAFLLGTGHIGTLRPAWAKTRNSQKKSRCLPWTTVSAQVIWAQWATPIRKWSGHSWIPSFQMPVTGQPSTQACLRITGLKITTWAPSAWTPLHHTHVCHTHNTQGPAAKKSSLTECAREWAGSSSWQLWVQAATQGYCRWQGLWNCHAGDLSPRKAEAVSKGTEPSSNSSTVGEGEAGPHHRRQAPLGKAMQRELPTHAPGQAQPSRGRRLAPEGLEATATATATECECAEATGGTLGHSRQVRWRASRKDWWFKHTERRSVSTCWPLASICRLPVQCFANRQNKVWEG